jgi:hypothetical protein
MRERINVKNKEKMVIRDDVREGSEKKLRRSPLASSLMK